MFDGRPCPALRPARGIFRWGNGSRSSCVASVWPSGFAFRQPSAGTGRNGAGPMAAIWSRTRNPCPIRSCPATARLVRERPRHVEKRQVGRPTGQLCVWEPDDRQRPRLRRNGRLDPQHGSAQCDQRLRAGEMPGRGHGQTAVATGHAETNRFGAGRVFQRIRTWAPALRRPWKAIAFTRSPAATRWCAWTSTGSRSRRGTRRRPTPR